MYLFSVFIMFFVFLALLIFNNDDTSKDICNNVVVSLICAFIWPLIIFISICLYIKRKGKEYE